jgi:hypothetical protein
MKLMREGEPKKAQAAFKAMMSMKKLDLPTLEKAYAQG